jgi:hypothetical protein
MICSFSETRQIHCWRNILCCSFKYNTTNVLQICSRCQHLVRAKAASLHNNLYFFWRDNILNGNSKQYSVIIPISREHDFQDLEVEILQWLVITCFDFLNEDCNKLTVKPWIQPGMISDFPLEKLTGTVSYTRGSYAIPCVSLIFPSDVGN